MSYIEKSMGEGERLVARAYFHWLYTFKALLVLVASLIFLIAALLYADEANRGWLIMLSLVLFGIGLIIFLRMMIRRWTTEIAVTSHRFVEKTGFVRLRTNEIALPNIEGVRVRQSIWGRIWGYGRLRIEGTGVDAVELPSIADPVGFRRAIETAKGIK